MASFERGGMKNEKRGWCDEGAVYFEVDEQNPSVGF
jgi:hypothetical protein